MGLRLMGVCHLQMWPPRPLGHLHPGQLGGDSMKLHVWFPWPVWKWHSSLSLHLLNPELSYMQGRLGKCGLAVDQPASLYHYGTPIILLMRRQLRVSG